MSAIEHNKGKLVLVSTNPEEFAEQHIKNLNTSLYDSKLDQFRDTCFEENLEIINNKVYKVEWEIQSDTTLNFAEVKENEDGSIDFHTLHHNGGAYWTEVIEDALKDNNGT